MSRIHGVKPYENLLIWFCGIRDDLEKRVAVGMEPMPQCHLMPQALPTLSLVKQTQPTTNKQGIHVCLMVCSSCKV